MLHIEEGKQLIMNNVLSLRKKMTQQQLQEEMMKIGQALQKLGVKKKGNLVTATFGIEEINGEQLLDIEILLPLDREVELPVEYKLKKEFRLVNAVYARHEGNPVLLQNTLQGMMDYISKRGLQQITAAYNVQVNEVRSEAELDGMIVDCYVGFSGNLL